MSPARNDPARADLEAHALRLSMIGSLFMAGLGIGFALLAGSDAVLLDGVYSLSSFVMALLARRVAGLVDHAGSETFHFGFAHFEPLLNLARGLLILGICAFALFSAADALLHGGRPISPGVALIYAGVAFAGCVALALMQRQFARRVGSPLLAVDARNWFIDGALSVGAGLAFLTAFFLQGSAWAHLLPYADPFIVAVLVLAMLAVPLATIRDNLKQVLQEAPDRAVQETVRRRVEQATGGIPREKTFVRMAHIGRFFYVLIHLVVEENTPPQPITEQDAVRARIRSALREIHPRPVVDVLFTADERWSTLLTGPERQQGDTGHASEP